MGKAEAKLKAEELLPAVEMVFAQGLASEEERGEIEAAATAVREALAAGAAKLMVASRIFRTLVFVGLKPPA